MASADEILKAQANAIADLYKHVIANEEVIRNLYQYIKDLERRQHNAETSAASAELALVVDRLWVRERLQIPVGTDKAG
ncbi:hypothetical protein LCGC14_1799050 [marine sediment metagenome]|uniref:Uncharacterized protein n=1 Tax=marine sediment metagenome TaxID=412755 RepID=A0A0F9J4Y0_9ZZZZ